MQATELIRIKRDGGALSPAQVQAFVDGLTGPAVAGSGGVGAGLAGHNPGGFSDAQAAAMAMAIVLRGMNAEETVALTRAMTHSGEVLSWRGLDLHGPVLDKHSTGGVGDKVSLLLAPIVAACGGLVPMISGRGLGHTGGTLDKLQALPGYNINPSRETLLGAMRHAGCAIVSASAELAPADRRLYAIRDVTATVESVPLITASILSKKLAAGLQGLVLDVKVGSGAFAKTLDEARTLARSLVSVATGAGLPARALITDMNAVLGHTAGHALEVQEAIDYFNASRTADPGQVQRRANVQAHALGHELGGPAGHRDARLHAVTMALCGQLLHLGGLARDVAQGQSLAEAALASGAAAERFARMVAILGGPTDVFKHAGLPTAPVQVDVPAPHAGVLTRIDARALGLAVLGLGGGRQQATDSIDMRVGLSHVLAPGTSVHAGQALARVHAASKDAAASAVQAVGLAMQVLRDAQPAAAMPEVIEVIEPAA
jgi:thymidine phosphorylase